jgi:serine/threonine protein kinase
VALYDVFEDDQYLFLVLELVTGGELFQKIVETGYFSEHKAARILKQIIEAIAYLHSHDVIHRGNAYLSIAVSSSLTYFCRLKSKITNLCPCFDLLHYSQRIFWLLEKKTFELLILDLLG